MSRSRNTKSNRKRRSPRGGQTPSRSSGPRELPFYKMHGIGNDFLVFDRVSQKVVITTEEIVKWSDRNTGIGFDQLLMIDPPTDPDFDFWYRIYNADGSEAEQCGNGTRSVALLARRLGLTKKQTLRWQSLAGPIQTTYSNPEQIETIMTVPVLSHADIVFDPSQAIPVDANDIQYDITGETTGTHRIVPVSMGNPHAVIFCDDVSTVDVDTVGGELTRHPAYPNGVNVGFCQIIDRSFIRLRVYERGTGETRACGSGACAAAVAARLLDLIGERVKISLPGGKLRIHWSQPDAPVTMSGAASLVFRGELQQKHTTTEN